MQNFSSYLRRLICPWNNTAWFWITLYNNVSTLTLTETITQSSLSCDKIFNSEAWYGTFSTLCFSSGESSKSVDKADTAWYRNSGDCALIRGLGICANTWENTAKPCTLISNGSK